jgi:DNA-binding NarL/FixJ family response regulator
VRQIKSALIVSRCKGLYRLGKWLLRRLRFRYVISTDMEGKALHRLINQFCPELILYDANFYGDITPRKIGCLVRDFPKRNLAVFNFSCITPEQAALFIRYGAKSYIDLSGAGGFWHGLKKILDGKEYISPAVREILKNLPETEKELRLDITGRMEDIKHLICEGKGNKQIAKLLGVSVKTVETQKTALFAMYGVKNALELFRYCLMLGEVEGFSKSA